jgi:hypothetical protein
VKDVGDKIPNNSSQRERKLKDGQVWLKPVKMLQQLVVLMENWCMNFTRILIEEAVRLRLVSCTVDSQECVLLYWGQAKNKHDCWD